MSKNELMDDNKFYTIFNKVIDEDRLIFEILGNPKIYPYELIDKLSLNVALKFWYNKISFEDADYFMNEVFSFWVQNFGFDCQMSDVSFSCYLAFDEGEYIRTGDEINTNPIEKYTKPQINKILKDSNLI